MAAADTPAAARGRTASSPWAIPWAGWKEVVARSWKEAGEDNIGLIAAGVAFYGFLAFVPLLGAIVLSYGLLADPATVVKNVQGLTTVMPTDAAKLVGEQLMNVVKTSGGKKGLGVLIALAVAIFGARSGAGSVVTALNVAYEEKEKRSFIVVNLLALAITAAAVLVAIIAVVAIAALGHLQKLVPGAPDVVLVLGKLLSYVLLGLGGAAAAATLYRYGPSRAHARWAWITPGSAFAALFWLLLTLGFGIYVAKFGNYNATYGSLGAVVVLLTWLYLSSYVLLLGAELNSEVERQTAEDTTEGAARPIGTRGASAADSVAPAAPGRDAAPHHRAVGSAPAALASPPSPLATFAAARATAVAGRVAGLGKVGLLPAVMTTTGLALLRRRGRALPGAVLVGAAAALAFLARPSDEADR